MNAADPRIAELAELVAFEHEPGRELPRPTPELDELERTAALAALALAGSEPVPTRVRTRLAAAGLSFCAERRAAGMRASAAPRTAGELRRMASTRRTWGAFLLGAAAVALLWLGLGWPLDARGAAQQRAALLAASHTACLSWQAGPSPLAGTVVGDVVWSDTEQQGYLTFNGLPPLDAQRCFQLWIVDGDREGPPVDGGVFAIEDATSETVIAVRPTLPIGRAAAFVVTVEDAAGAVVSAQEHVVAIARS
jgi:hypothetical protein